MKTNNDHATYIEKPITRLTGKRATGFIAFTKNPSSGNKITIDGVDYVFGTHIVIGTDVYETINNIMFVITLPDNVLLFVRNNRLELTSVLTGSSGNSITFSTDVNGAYTSGPTLINGVDMDTNHWVNDKESTIKHKPPLLDYQFHNENNEHELLSNEEVTPGDKLIIVTDTGIVEDNISYTKSVVRNIDPSQDTVLTSPEAITNKSVNIVEEDFATQYDTRLTFGHRVYNAVTLSTKDKLYVLGGNDIAANNSAPFSDIFVIDKNDGPPITSIDLYGQLPHALTSGAIYSTNNRFYILGGKKDSGVTDEILIGTIYDNGDIGDIKVSTVKLPTLLTYLEIVIIKDKLYIFGGYADGALNKTVYVSSLYEDGTLVGNWAEHTKYNFSMVSGALIKTSKYVYYTSDDNDYSKIYRATYDPDTGYLGDFITLTTTFPEDHANSGTIVTKDNVYIFGGAWTDTIVTAPITEDGELGKFRIIPYTAPYAYSYVIIFVIKNYIYFTRVGPLAMSFSDIWPDEGNVKQLSKTYTKFGLENTVDYSSIISIYRKSDIRLSLSYGDSDKRATTGFDEFIVLEPTGVSNREFYVHSSVNIGDKIFVDDMENRITESIRPRLGSVPNLLKDSKELVSFGFDHTLINTNGTLTLTPSDSNSVEYLNTSYEYFVKIPDGIALISTIDADKIKAISARVHLTDTEGAIITNNDVNSHCYIKIFIVNASSGIIGVTVQLQDNVSPDFTYLLEETVNLGFAIDTDKGVNLFSYVEFGGTGVTKIQVNGIKETTFTPTTDGEFCSKIFFGHISIGNSIDGLTMVDTAIGNLRFYKSALTDEQLNALYNETFNVRKCTFESDITDHTFACKKYLKEIEVVENISATEKRVRYYEKDYLQVGDILKLGDEESIISGVTETVISQDPFATFPYNEGYYSNNQFQNLSVTPTVEPVTGWEYDTNIPHPKNLLHKYIVVGKYVYGMGGFTTRADPYKTSIIRATINEDGSLTSFTTYRDFVSNVTYTTVINVGKYVYVIGGRSWVEGWKSEIYRAEILSDGELGEFEKTANLPYGINVGMATSINSDIYFMGGVAETGNNHNVFRISQNGTKCDIASAMPLTFKEGACFTTKHRIYICGNYASDTIYYADIDSDGLPGVWAASPIQLPSNLCRFSLLVVENAVYILGGNIDLVTISDKIYRAPINADSSLGEFTLIGILPTPTQRQSLVVTSEYIYLLSVKNTDVFDSLRIPWTDGWLLDTYTNEVEDSVIEANITHEEVLNVKPDTLFVNKNTMPLFDYRIKIKQESTNILSVTTTDPHNWVYDPTVSLTMLNLTKAISVKNKIYYIHARETSGQGDIFVSTVNTDGTIEKPVFYRSVEPSEFRSAVINDDKYIYIIGGDDSGVYSDKIYRMEILEDGNLGTCELSGNLPAPLHSPAIVNINNNIYIFGGYNTSGSLETIIKISNYGTITDVIGSMPGVGRYHELILTRSSIYIIGGRTNVIYRASIRDDGTFTKFTVDENTFPFSMSLATPIVTSNAVYVIGGTDAVSGDTLDTVYKADIDSAGIMGSFYLVGNSPTTVGNYVLTVTKNRIYILNARDTNGGYVEPLVASWEDGWQGYQTDTMAVPELKSFGLKNDIVEAELIDTAYDGNAFINTYGPTNVDGKSTQRKITICEKDVEILEPLITGVSIIES